MTRLNKTFYIDGLVFNSWLGVLDYLGVMYG